MPLRFHVTPAQGIAQLTALLLLLLWLIKLRCRTWATRLYFIGVLVAIVAAPFTLAGEAGFAPFGAVVTSGGLALALWGIVLDTRSTVGPGSEAADAAILVDPLRRSLLRTVFSPGSLTIGLLLGVCVLWSAEHVGWDKLEQPGFKGWPVLISLAAIVVTAMLTSVWWGAARFFRWRFELPRGAWVLFMTAAALSCGWYTAAISAAHLQRAFRLGIEGHGWLYCGPDYVEKNPLHHVLGYDFFATPLDLQLNSTPMADLGLKPLSGTRHLRSFELNDCPNITDAGIQYLGSLCNFRRLIISGSRITDQGLRSFAGSTQMDAIYLRNCPVTGAAFESLIKLANLRELDLESLPLTDAGLAGIGKLTSIRELDLADTPVTDAGLAQLKNLMQLEWLDLRRTKITDASVPVLKGLQQLRRLRVGDVKGISAFGDRQLEEGLPNCAVDYSP